MSSIPKPARAPRATTKREQREASIEKILKASLRLFVSKGYRSATVDEIAAGAELTKGAVYFYFPTKSAILMALFDQIEELIVDRMVERVAAAGPDLQDKLIAFMHGQSVVGAEKAELVTLYILMLLEFNHAGDEIERRVKGIHLRLTQSVEELMHRGKLTGEFRTDLDTREVAAIIMALHNGTFLEWYCRGESLSGPGLVRALRGVMLNGVMKKAG
ncbi:TetR/AcrR family transcriptional regulator [Lacisediminimonas profundi]|uniref:TetR/AcrR family transcriptional regulator n=1 Tax=Lacisediminimonas profundi TaxID=2603856 RepID=UPI00124B277E|nr:TetR/AcrR family transcriptional regulator [Lacisediminimonas profundi]